MGVADLSCGSAPAGLLAGTPWRWLGRIDFAEAVALNAAACARLRAAPAGGRLGEIACFEPAAAVFTLGLRAQTPAGRASLGPSVAACAARGIATVDVERGGLGTLHLPGQLVVFLAIPCPRTRLRALVCDLLGAARTVAAAAGVPATIDSETDVGLWTEATQEGRRRGKLASIGLYESRGVVGHGLALNVAVDPAAGAGLALCGSASTAYASLVAPGTAPAAAVHAAALAFARAGGLVP